MCSRTANVPPSRRNFAGSKLPWFVDVSASRSFRIEYLVGQGGFGQVYRAILRTASGLETTVALKLLRSDLRPDSSAAARLRDEARLLAQIRHPAIAATQAIVHLRSRLGIVSEFVDGADLSKLLRDDEPPPPSVVVAVVGDVAAALHTAWTARSFSGTELRVVHRDVKPSNIRVGRHANVKLLDFGVAKCTDTHREAFTDSGVMIGSARYLAPERFTERVATHTSDVFSLGCCLYEALARTSFHTTRSLPALAVLARDPLKFKAHKQKRLGHLPPDAELVRPLLNAMLAFDAHDRPVADEVAVECRRLAKRVPGPTLRQWCGSRAWPSTAHRATALDGQRLYEDAGPSNAASPHLTHALRRPAPPRPRRWMALVSGASVLVMTLTSAALFFLWWVMSQWGMF